jgi:hypothetical protein
VDGIALIGRHMLTTHEQTRFSCYIIGFRRGLWPKYARFVQNRKTNATKADIYALRHENVDVYTHCTQGVYPTLFQAAYVFNVYTYNAYKYVYALAQPYAWASCTAWHLQWLEADAIISTVATGACYVESCVP